MVAVAGATDCRTEEVPGFARAQIVTRAVLQETAGVAR